LPCDPSPRRRDARQSLLHPARGSNRRSAARAVHQQAEGSASASWTEETACAVKYPLVERQMKAENRPVCVWGTFPMPTFPFIFNNIFTKPVSHVFSYTSTQTRGVKIVAICFHTHLQKYLHFWNSFFYASLELGEVFNFKWVILGMRDCGKHVTVFLFYNIFTKTPIRRQKSRSVSHQWLRG
jgi:hypothetical protein